jgi:hypothetical protein
VCPPCRLVPGKVNHPSCGANISFSVGLLAQLADAPCDVQPSRTLLRSSICTTPLLPTAIGSVNAVTCRNWPVNAGRWRNQPFDGRGRSRWLPGAANLFAIPPPAITAADLRRASGDSAAAQAARAGAPRGVVDRNGYRHRRPDRNFS